MKKVRVGIFSFTCDEGCSIVFLEILNRKFFEWEDEMELRNCRVLRLKMKSRVWTLLLWREQYQHSRK